MFYLLNCHGFNIGLLKLQIKSELECTVPLLSLAGLSDVRFIECISTRRIFLCIAKVGSMVSTTLVEAPCPPATI